jgi:hypothetical protein
VFEARRAESRVLVTLDRDFGKALRFPPATTAGVVVLDLGPPPNSQALLDRLNAFLAILPTRPLAGTPWTIEPAACASTSLTAISEGQSASFGTCRSNFSTADLAGVKRSTPKQKTADMGRASGKRRFASVLLRQERQFKASESGRE